jgi:hypothetical protein
MGNDFSVCEPSCTPGEVISVCCTPDTPNRFPDTKTHNNTEAREYPRLKSANGQGIKLQEQRDICSRALRPLRQSYTESSKQIQSGHLNLSQTGAALTREDPARSSDITWAEIMQGRLEPNPVQLAALKQAVPRDAHYPDMSPRPCPPSPRHPKQQAEAAAGGMHGGGGGGHTPSSPSSSILRALTLLETSAAIRADNVQEKYGYSQPPPTKSPSSAISYVWSSTEAACMQRQFGMNANYQRPPTLPNQVDGVSVFPVFPSIENGYIPGSGSSCMSPRGQGQVHQCCTSAKLLIWHLFFLSFVLPADKSGVMSCLYLSD